MAEGQRGRFTDRESRFGGLVLTGVPSSELLSSSSDSSDCRPSTMERRGPEDTAGREVGVTVGSHYGWMVPEGHS